MAADAPDVLVSAFAVADEMRVEEVAQPQMIAEINRGALPGAVVLADEIAGPTTLLLSARVGS